MHVGFLGAPLIGILCTLGLGSYGGLGLWLILRGNSLAIGGWMQIAAKKWFEEEFYDSRFAKFVQFTKRKPVQILLMLINVVLITLALIITFINALNIYLFKITKIIM
jgi:hypothetical protein